MSACMHAQGRTCKSGRLSALLWSAVANACHSVMLRSSVPGSVNYTVSRLALLSGILDMLTLILPCMLQSNDV